MGEQNLIFWDLREHPDQRLLHRFYNDFMITAFPLEDERDPVESWEHLLSDEARSSLEDPAWHLLLVFDQKDRNKTNILAGGAFEHYAKSNCALLTYVVIHPDCRGQGLARQLIAHEVAILQRDARQRCQAGDCRAVFAEMNSPQRIQEAQDVMNPALRLKIFDKIGFRKLDFDYIQPPLSPEQQKCKDLVLAIYPGSPYLRNVGGTPHLPSPILRDFLEEFYGYLCTYDFTQDPDFQFMMRQLADKPEIRLGSLSC